MEKIRSFTGLHAWQESHKLVLMIYSMTEKFPATEQFGLCTQMQRAAVSVSSNIAEGFRRKTRKEKQRFYEMALASLTEIQNQLIIARDLKYTDKATFQNIAEQTVTAGKLINGLIKSAMGHHRS